MLQYKSNMSSWFSWNGHCNVCPWVGVTDRPRQVAQVATSRGLVKALNAQGQATNKKWWRSSVLHFFFPWRRYRRYQMTHNINVNWLENRSETHMLSYRSDYDTAFAWFNIWSLVTPHITCHDQHLVGTLRSQCWSLWRGLGFDQWSLPGMDENCSSSYISKSMGKSGWTQEPSETWTCCWLLKELKTFEYLGIPRELGFLVTFVICDLIYPLIESSHCHRWTQISKLEQGSGRGSHSLHTSRGLNKPGLWFMSSTTSPWRNFMVGRRWTSGPGSDANVMHSTEITCRGLQFLPLSCLIYNGYQL